MRKRKSIYDFMPDVDNVWDFELNYPVKPCDVSPKTHKKYYWKCLKGHPSYLCKVDNKITRNDGCPVCSNRKVIFGINDFETNHPELMKDWDYEKNKGVDPKKISMNSCTSVYWKCHACGHEWRSKIQEAVRKKINCPVCSFKEMGKRRHASVLQTKGCFCDKELLLDWDYEKNQKQPNEYSPHSSQYVFWKCHKCGYRWSTKLNNRTSNKRGCPCCQNKKLLPGFNDLATVNPKLAAEWHPTKNGELKPNMVFSSQNKKVWWLCPVGHEYMATINHRSSTNGTNCPICNSGRQTSFREQALYFYVKKLFPDARSRYKPNNNYKFELDIYIPSTRIAVEYDGVAWHKSEKFDRERRKFLMCKEMGIKLIRIKEKMPEELAFDIADTIISADDFETEEGFEDALHAALKEIDITHLYQFRPLDINLSRDRFEIMKYATAIKHSFADECPEKAKEWHPTKNGTLKPTMFKPWSDFKAWWVCPKCGNEYEQSIAHKREGNGCPKCAISRFVNTRRANQVKQRGSIANPLLLAEWNYEKNGTLKPENYTKASDVKAWWKCSVCGHEWQSKISNRYHGRGCPNCANMNRNKHKKKPSKG